MFIVRPPAIITKFLFNLTWRIPSTDKTIYLTFDDGPIPETTPKILEILDQYNAKATFFCVGENVEKNPDLFMEIKNKRHSVGNHTFNHLKGWATPNFVYFRNVERADALIHSSLFRAPYGKISTTQRATLSKKYNIIMWDVLSGDYDSRISPQQCLQNVLKYTRKGSVIVFHDSIKAKKNMLFALPKVLEHFTALGYKFKAITTEVITQKERYRTQPETEFIPAYSVI
jgi:peptidoglycan/xylan/chitin deacetylase (PgdA/CDA1 family)